MKILIADSDTFQLKAYRDNTLKLFAFLHECAPKDAISIQYCSTGGELASLMDSSSCSFDLSIIDRALSGIPGDIIIELFHDRLGNIIICSSLNNIKELPYLQKPVDLDKLSELIKEVLHVTDKRPDTDLQEYEIIA